MIPTYRNLILVICLAICLPPSIARSATQSSTQQTKPQSWHQETVFYEIFVRSFADSTTGPRAHDGIGDLQGLIEHLDYLNDGDPKTDTDLGITGIWLMPIMQSNSYHGYDIVDYYNVEQDYGTNQDFQRLMTQAHRRGIRIIIDLVLNHTSSRNPWFIESSQNNTDKRNWYCWLDEKPAYPRFNQRNGRWFYAYFSRGMPDLNFQNEQVTEQMFDVTRFWIEQMQTDGFRLDAIRHLIEDGPVSENTPQTHQWLRQYHTFYKNLNPEIITVGEIWDKTDIVASYIGDQVDLAFQFDLAGAILQAVNQQTNQSVIKQLNLITNNFPPGQYATFLTNHDQNRVMSVLNQNIEKAKLAATVLLTLPGVPFIYYGEEIGMTGRKPDPKIRTPMQWKPTQHAGFSTTESWQPPNPDYQKINVLNQNENPNSLLNHYRKLIRLRQAHPALMTGEFLPVEVDNQSILTYLRISKSENILIVINLSEQPVEQYALSLNKSPLTGVFQTTELLHGANTTPVHLDQSGGFKNYQPLKTLAPQTPYIIKFNN